MDLLPKIGGVDPYHGGAPQQRPGTGAFARKRKEEEERKRREQESAATPQEFEVDPLLAEIDRLRVLDPALTESGAHRALLALRAYHRQPGELGDEPQAPPPPPPLTAPDAASTADAAGSASTRAFTRRSPTPPGPATGSDAPAP